MITFDYLIMDYKYQYSEIIDNRKWFAFGNTLDEFDKGLKQLGLYEKYYKININIIEKDGQLSFDL